MIGGIQDSINLISGMTWKRSFNAAKILHSYYLSRAQKRPRMNGLPISLSIEPTTSCNLRCPECPSGLRSFTRPTGKLDPALYGCIIDQLASTLSYLTFYFQGEPYLHPDFLEMVSYASSKEVYTATSTNAHYLTADMARATVESGLDRLIISIDGTTQEAYESYRIGGSLTKVVDATKHIIAAKRQLKSKTPHVVFQFLVVGPNEHQIAQVENLAKVLQVDQLVLKTAQVYNFENGSPLIPRQERYSRYRKNRDGSYSIKNKMDDHCWKMWHSCVITWDGKVIPCCFDKDAHFVLGDLKEESFDRIWNGEKYNAFRRSLLTSRGQIEMCRNCTEGGRIFA